MPVLDQLTRKIADRMPTVINPTAHAIIDYGVATAFLAFAARSWKRDRRAALSSIGVSAAELAIALLTDYPGGVTRHLSLADQGRIDIGLCALVGTMPDMMGFRDDRSTRFFRMQAVLMAAVAGLTDFERSGKRKQLKRIEEAA